MAKNNPFREARSIKEFFQMLRAELTKLRGKPFRYWKLANVRIYGDELYFELDADRTYSKRRGSFCDDITWCELAEGERIWRDDGWSKRLQNWKGFGIFRASGRRSGDKPNTCKVYARVHLRYLPNIKKMRQHNTRLEERRGRVGEKDKELLRLDAQIAELRAKRQDRREALLNEFAAKNFKFDLDTGKVLR